MTVELLTEHHFEFLSLKGDCTGSSESMHVKNATLLEIHVHVTCHGSYYENQVHQVKLLQKNLIMAEQKYTKDIQ